MSASTDCSERIRPSAQAAWRRTSASLSLSASASAVTVAAGTVCAPAFEQTKVEARTTTANILALVGMAVLSGDGRLCDRFTGLLCDRWRRPPAGALSLIHISEPTRL